MQRAVAHKHMLLGLLVSLLRSDHVGILAVAEAAYKAG